MACHSSVPTLSLLNHRNIFTSANCTRYGLHEETFLHCVRDCEFSRNIWYHFNFNHFTFFDYLVPPDWLKDGLLGAHSFTFAAIVWWAWRHRNIMCLSNENWSLNRLVFNIQGMIETLKNCFSVNRNGVIEERFTKWNDNNHSSVILNVDGSCLGSPSRAGYGGLLRNHDGYYLSGFSGYIHNSFDILYAELFTIYQGLLLAKEKNVADLVCYSDSMRCINLIKGPAMKFHNYVVLIQDIKELFVHVNVTICHILREGNQCANFLAKLKASSYIDYCHHASPPMGLLGLLRIDAAGTIFPRL